jgi:hypothetical protein
MSGYNVRQFPRNSHPDSVSAPLPQLDKKAFSWRPCALSVFLANLLLVLTNLSPVSLRGIYLVIRINPSDPGIISILFWHMTAPVSTPGTGHNAATGYEFVARGLRYNSEKPWRRAAYERSRSLHCDQRVFPPGPLREFAVYAGSRLCAPPWKQSFDRRQVRHAVFTGSGTSCPAACGA